MTGIALLASPLGGCEAPPEGAPGEVTPESLADDASLRWPYRPADMRIHPLTRLVTDEDGRYTQIETRIELFDIEGHTTKGCGRLRIDLHAVEGGIVSAALMTWNLDLRDPTFNRERYDVVTRTYLFGLEPDPGETIPDQPALKAYYLTGDGRPLPVRELRLRTD